MQVRRVNFKALLIVLGTYSAINCLSIQPLLAQACDSGILGDRDGDNIPDVWENAGTDVNGDGKKELNLVSRGASPYHKDIFLEIDYMQQHQPYSQVIPDVLESFRGAPVCNPDGTSGIRLHVQLDQQIPHQDSIRITEENGARLWKGFYDLKNDYFGTTREKLDSNVNQILLAKNYVYHYVIFGHNFDTVSNSGISNGIPGMDFIVSLGAYKVTASGTNHYTGSPSQQASTLMHELGHNLGLRHGGGDDTNCKPNYMSVMSYTRQFETPIPNRPLDYSRSAIEPLTENDLDEMRGIGTSHPEGLVTAYGPGNPFLATTGGPIDWNRDGYTGSIGIDKDINLISNINGCSGSSTNQLLNGFDDWQNLIYDIKLYTRLSAMNLLAQSSESMGAVNANISEGLSNLTSTLFSPAFNNLNNSFGIFGSPLDNEPSLDDEMTPEDVRRLNLGLVLSLNDKIQQQLSNETVHNNSVLSLSDELGKSIEVDELKNFYQNRLIGDSLESALSAELEPTNDTSVINSIKSDNLDQAIQSLNNLLPTMDSSFGGALSDDNITRPDTQLVISAQINNVVEAFKSQSCTYEDCITVQKAPNATIEY